MVTCPVWRLHYAITGLIYSSARVNPPGGVDARLECNRGTQNARRIVVPIRDRIGKHLDERPVQKPAAPLPIDSAEAFGRHAVEMLVAQFEQSPLDIPHLILPFNLIVRGSTAAVART
jgi:hypothetical protein